MACDSRIRFLVFGVLAGLLVACGLSVEYTPTNAPPHPLLRRPPDSVRVFFSKPPQIPYAEVGVLQVRQQQYNHSGQSAIVAAMRKEAARRGCDALVITGSANEVVGGGSTYGGEGSMSIRTLKGLRGSCIVFTGPPQAATPPAAAPPAPPPPRTACVPGATQACVGPGGCKGGQACKDDGSGFKPCDCGPAPAADAGVPGDGGTDSGNRT